MAAGSGIYKDCFGSEGVEPAKLEGYFHLTPYAKWASRSPTPPPPSTQAHSYTHPCRWGGGGCRPTAPPWSSPHEPCLCSYMRTPARLSRLLCI